MKISLTDFRAFASTGPLEIRPLTFLVGENSSGKTSLLSALSYVWRIQERMLNSSFNVAPFDLGTFDEIVHRVRGRTRPDNFKVEIENTIQIEPHRSAMYYGRSTVPRSSGRAHLCLTFVNNVGDALIKNLELRYGEYSLIVAVEDGVHVVVKTNGKVDFDSRQSSERTSFGQRVGKLDKIDISDVLFLLRRLGRDRIIAKDDSPLPSDESLAVSSLALEALTNTFPRAIFASAPVRSNPSRVYTLSDQVRSPDGNHTPQTLFKIKESDENRWLKLKDGIEQFGKLSGMFTSINVARYKSSGSSPFQINVTRKGKQSNIVDVGYGVSQALPILTDLIESPARSGFLFQQPEVHLHPQAQAALGSYFVDFLRKNRNSTIVAETHSDYLIDRVRICILNGLIRPNDVSILYFSSSGTSTDVSQISIDSTGNIVDVPTGYRDFFITEQMDLLGISV